jgi:hypothetical protein
MDLVMLTLTNAREREEADWIELFEKAESRFGDVRISTPEGATMSIIEVVWGGDETEDQAVASEVQGTDS